MSVCILHALLESWRTSGAITRLAGQALEMNYNHGSNQSMTGEEKGTCGRCLGNVIGIQSLAVSIQERMRGLVRNENPIPGLAKLSFFPSPAVV